MGPKVESILQEYIKEAKLLKSPEGACPRCGEDLAGFKRHDTRERKFRVVVEQMVYIFVALLTRWKCPVYKRTFTQYPSFASSYKRFNGKEKLL